jgi:hypothetical protein
MLSAIHGRGAVECSVKLSQWGWRIPKTCADKTWTNSNVARIWCFFRIDMRIPPDRTYPGTVSPGKRTRFFQRCIVLQLRYIALRNLNALRILAPRVRLCKGAYQEP